MAAVTTALIAVVCVVVGGVLDLVVIGRLTHQVDERLAAAIHDAGRQSGPPTTDASGFQPGRDLDDAPVLLWRVGSTGAVTALTTGAPALPAAEWVRTEPGTVSLGGRRFRLTSEAQPTGWLVAAESLAPRDHVRNVVLVAEAVVAPVVLLACYLGSLAIGLKAAAPVERTRRRQLEFTADASHELRTPLSVIEAEVGLALGTPREAPYYRSSLERVAEESGRLRRIVEDMLWLARFDSEPPPPRDEPVDLAVLAAGCAERFHAVATGRGLAVELRGGPATPVLINAPRDWVDRLCGVLVDNACRYSPSGATVTVSVAAVGARAVLAVEDAGPGIPAEERERLFDRFHRASDQPGGAGLGLAIADSVVRSTAARWRIGTSPAGGARMEVSWRRAAGSDHRDSGSARVAPGPEPVAARSGPDGQPPP